MSKQSQANNIYEHGIEAGFSRKDIIAEIVMEVGVSAAYASTLYNNARKAVQSATTPTLTTPVTPVVKSTGSINEFNSRNIDAVQADIKAALEAVMNKHGISIEFGGIRYSNSNYTSKMSVNVGNAEDAARTKFASMCHLFGLKPEDFGREFTTSSGKTFTITGINPGRRKYPISGVSPRGAKYKFTEDQVIRGLK